MLDVDARAAVHSALGEPLRLRMVDALELSDLSPSELGQHLGIDSNLVAHHLAVLEGVGLVQRAPSRGDRRRRYLRLCREVLELLPGSVPMPVSEVVFVCTANSARSQLAAALWGAASAVRATSAGTEPASEVHPLARRAASRRGLDLGSRHPSPLPPADQALDLVVTVCDRAHEQLGRRPVRCERALHWSIADPAEAGTARAFEEAADELERRIAQLVSRVAQAGDGQP